MCERVEALVNGRDLTMKDPKQPIKIKPNFCNMNAVRQQTIADQLTIKNSGQKLVFLNERLYMDVYDYEKGKFTGMSDAMRTEYKKDLATV